ncbi:MAG: hypothetical protein BroJett013_07520 [Alphaproteobacteria bacterium]|nr:MAG: hypothetical protein BroJett013_07520 [Alphaproteobacteria bacterium]
MSERAKKLDEERFDLAWIDHEREPRCAPNPDYPDGKDVDATFGQRPACRSSLPYPAARCGLYVVRCKRCKASVGITTAGRPDDPRSVRIPCKEMPN